MTRLNFLDKSPRDIIQGLAATYQASTGKVLYPSQVENLLLHVLAYRESLLRNDIQHCAGQNLVAYAIGPHLDRLGDMMACPRLQPAAAQCRVRFALAAPAPQGRSIPAGTRIATEDGGHVFLTAAPAYVLSGQSQSTIVTATAEATGAAPNGLPTGAICKADPAIPWVSAENVTEADQGADLETDEAYRARLMLSSTAYGSGGTAAGYRYHALSASALIADALAVPGDASGHIVIYILTQDGHPSGDLLAAVNERCNRPDIRIIGDYITAMPAIAVPYAIRASLTIYDTHDPALVMDRVNALAAQFAHSHRQRLGYDVTPTQVLMALSQQSEALYHVELHEPSGIVPIGPAQWPNCTEIEINLAGVSNG